MLQAANLSCVRQQKSLFENISFALTSNEVLLIEGPNGAGKSSLIRLLAGLATPLMGDIYWHGKSIQQIRFDYQQQMHYIGHKNALKLGLTVNENIMLFTRAMLAPMPAHYHEVLSHLELTAYQDTQVAYLSAGQKRRVALAKVFLFPKRLWILDEPLTALDVATQHIFLNKLQSHLKNDGMCVLSSHHPLALNEANIKTLRLLAC